MAQDNELSGDDVAVEELRRDAEGGEGISVIRGGGNLRGWNGIRYGTGMSAKHMPAKHMPAQHKSMSLATLPPHAAAAAGETRSV